MTSQSKNFETEACSRCGGSGHYSYNQINGTTCFKCSGAGKTYTKRGAAAKKFLTDSYMGPVADVKVGDVVQYKDMSRAFFIRVTKVSEPYEYGKSRNHETGEWKPSVGVSIKGANAKHGECGMVMPVGAIVRMGQTAEQKREKIAAALAYQDLLTKQGKPRKRAAA